VIGQPKAGDGQVEMIRALRLARRSAMKARTQAANQPHALVVTAPDGLRNRLRTLSTADLVTRAAAFRPVLRGGALASPMAATKLAMKLIAARYQKLGWSRPPRRTSSPSRGSAPISPGRSSWLPATIRAGSVARLPSPPCVASPPSPLHPVSPIATDSVAVEIVTPTAPSTSWPWDG
jgi:hypothetical protein